MRVAAIAAAFVVATGGIAAAGVLPDSIQEPIADLYGIVGFNFHPGETADDDGAGDDDGERGEEGDGEVAPVGVKEDVAEFRAYFEALYVEVVKAIDQGMSKDEAVDTIELPEYSHLGMYDEWFKLNVDGMYRHIAANYE